MRGRRQTSKKDGQIVAGGPMLSSSATSVKNGFPTSSTSSAILVGRGRQARVLAVPMKLLAVPMKLLTTSGPAT